jgi:hypothetical protein
VSTKKSREAFFEWMREAASAEHDERTVAACDAALVALRGPSAPA